MIGGGEFIINGAERVIVNQLHRSPGVDFLVEVQEGDRPLHGCRVIPERGSWIECSVTKKDALAVRIDQSSKIPATTFLRPWMRNIRHQRSDHPRVLHGRIRQSRPTATIEYYAVGTIIDAESGEELVKAGGQIGEASTRSRPVEPQERRLRHQSDRPADSQHVGRRQRRPATKTH